MTPPSHNLARRRLLLKGFATLPFGLPFAAAHAASERRLAFHHTHTGEKLEAVFRNHNGYVSDGLKQLNWLLRDFRTGEMAEIDPRLFDILHAIALSCGGSRFEIISGYRSPKTNNMLRRTRGGGVAKRSLHMDGKAIDIRLRGCDTARVRDAAIALGAGGVGYYPESDFVHIDTGRVRSWGPKKA